MRGLMTMTSYEKGFITKCAEYGIDGRQLLEKIAFDKSAIIDLLKKYGPSAFSGAILFGLPAAIMSKKEDKLTNGVLSTILGGVLSSEIGRQELKKLVNYSSNNSNVQ